MTHLPTGIVVKSQATRSKSENYNIARRILAEKVELLEKGDESRVTKKAEKAAKKKASADKKKRRKYRKLSEEKIGKEGKDPNDDDVASENDDGEPGQDMGR
jgi:peptide chain release factor